MSENYGAQAFRHYPRIIRTGNFDLEDLLFMSVGDVLERDMMDGEPFIAGIAGLFEAETRTCRTVSHAILDVRLSHNNRYIDLRLTVHSLLEDILTTYDYLHSSLEQIATGFRHAGTELWSTRRDEIRMSWLCEPGKDLFESFKDRSSPDELHKVNDPQAPSWQKREARRSIELKYGLDAARLADRAIQAAQHAERQKNLQIWTARQARQRAKLAMEVVRDQEQVLDLARAEAQRLSEIAGTEEEVIQLTTRVYEDVRQKADQRFDEFYSAAKKGKIIDMASPLSIYPSHIEGQWEKAFCRTLEDPIHPSSEVVCFQPVGRSLADFDLSEHRARSSLFLLLDRPVPAVRSEALPIPASPNVADLTPFLWYSKVAGVPEQCPNTGTRTNWRRDVVFVPLMPKFSTRATLAVVNPQTIPPSR
ncbi:hypothetical protein HD553DRAFT_325391 [Filobasidium floriforme]|uniref:uncharacterized protein n=1 Tax=Filobasidium floriforme TaxID=5210 RepID=UPI001E8CFCC3|nr:uncharacterized protein HD553DRAFT_325391 [Filobasidium floriforme]KAH8081958.1 hypothetical protein HD553DRAFT_325391 [Filobasidium floriforme]